MGERRETVLRWLPSVAWMAVIFVVSSMPGSELTRVSDWSTYGHLAEYAVLGGLLASAAWRTWPRLGGALFALAVASAYGITDEVHQLFTPGRMSDPLDWLTDTVGAALGIALVAAFQLQRSRRSRLSGS